MADYAEADRVQIRRYLGYSSLFLQADPRLESAINASRAVADGGTRPDASLQTQILADITSCQGIDTAIANLRPLIGVTQAGKGAATIDAARETARLRSEGSSYVSRIAAALDVEEYRDPFQAMSLVRRNPAANFPYARNPY
jgi:hypothetical protein